MGRKANGSAFRFTPTRRTFLVGAAATAATAAAAGAVWRYEFVYDNDARRRRALLLRFPALGDDNRKGVVMLDWDRMKFGPRASFLIKASGWKDAGGALRADTWRLEVRDAQFPGAPAFSLAITVKAAGPAEDWAIGAESAFFWDDSELKSEPRNLTVSAFLGERGLTAEPLRFRVERRGTGRGAGASNAMLAALFGKRVETAGPVDISLDNEAGWALDAADPRRPFEALTLDLEFQKIKLVPTISDAAGTTSRDAIRPTAGQPSPRSSSKPSAFLFEAASAAALRGAKPSPRTLGLYGEIYGGVQIGAAGAGGGRRFDFASAAMPRLDPQRLSVLVELDAGTDVVTEAAIRHWGAPAYTVAGYVRRPRQTDADHLPSNGSLTLSGQGDRIDGPFEFRSLEITRQLERARPGAPERIVTRLTARPSLKEWTASTAAGAIVVGGLPAEASPKGLLAAPAIEAVAIDEGRDERILKSFKARLALWEAGVALPERYGEVGTGRHTARLQFKGAEALFHAPFLDKEDPISAADAVIPIGPKAVERDSWVEFSLDQARLSLLRADDLLALKFAFSGLVLKAPWRAAGVATLGPPGLRSACRMPAPALAAPLPRPTAEAKKTLVEPLQPARDTRPMLVVEFPPQHVLEAARFVQTPAPPDLPDLATLGTCQSAACRTIAHAIDLLRRPAARTVSAGSTDRGTIRRERIEARKEIRSNLGALPWPTGALAAFEKFASDFETAAQHLPHEQRLYVGVEFLDADARRVANAIAVPRAADPPTLTSGERHAAINLAIRRMRDDLDGIDLARLVDAVACGPGLKPDIGALNGLVVAPDAEPNKVKVALAATIAERANQAIKNELASFDTGLPDIAEGRLAGPSRIAFRLNCDDYQSERLGGRIPFTVEGLTDWASMDMAVVRRAERLMLAPNGERMPPRWMRRASADEADQLLFQDIQPGDHQTRRKQAGTLRRSRERMADVYRSLAAPPGPFETALELPARLFLSPAQDATWRTPRPSVARDAAEAIRRRAARDDSQPGLKPHSNAELFQELWTASLADVGRPNDESAENAARRVSGGVRAVWSPDLRPQALLSINAPGAPPSGPYAPWEIDGAHGIRSPIPDREPSHFRTSLDAYDRHELVLLTAAHGLPVQGRRRASGALIDDGSQFAPPPGWGLADAKKEWVGTGSASSGQPGFERDLSAIYRPAPLSLAELSLSAMGGSLDLDTAFIPPASLVLKNAPRPFDALTIERWRHRAVIGRDVAVEVVYKGYLFPLGIRASLVKFTERSFVRGRNGAPIAMLTQRMFLRVGVPTKAYPAYGQPDGGRRWPTSGVELLTRRTPDIVDPAEGRSCAASTATNLHVSGRIDLGIAATGLCFWPRTAARDGAEVVFEMRFAGEPAAVRMPLVFVDNAAANDPATVKLLIAYYNDALEPPGVKLNDAPVDADAGLAGPTRRLMRLSQPVRMAPDAKPGDTAFEMGWWDLKAEGRQSMPPRREPSGLATEFERRVLQNDDHEVDSFMAGLDQPPFYPFIAAAKLRLAQVERLTGEGPRWAVAAYDGLYAERGFPPPAPVPGQPAMAAPEELPRDPEDGIFLRILDRYRGHNNLPIRLDLDGRGERGGAVGQPNQVLAGLSRSRGLVGFEREPYNQDPTDVSANDLPVLRRPAHPPAPLAPTTTTPQPSVANARSAGDADFLQRLFPPNARLLGLVPLAQVIKLAANTLLQTQPKLLETVEYGAAAAAGAGAELRGFVSEKLLGPAHVLVGRVEADWKAVAEKLGDAGAAPWLGQAFPELARDLQALRTAIESAQDAGSDALFLAALAAVHEAGTNLGRTFDRIAQDPIAAAFDASRTAKIRQLFQQLREDPGDVLKLFAEALVPTVWGRALQAVEDNPALLRAVFVLPNELAEPDDVGSDFRARASRALVSAVRVGRVVIQTAPPEAIADPATLMAAAEAFKLELTQAIEVEAKSAQAAIAAALRAAGAEIASLTADAVLRTLTVAPPEIEAAIAALRQRLPVALSPQRSVAERIEAAADVARTLLSLVGGPEQLPGINVTAFCASARSIAADLKGWLPAGDLKVDDALGPMRTLVLTAAGGLPSIPGVPAIEKARAALKALADDVSLARALNRLVAAVREAGAAFDVPGADVCVLPQRLLPALREIGLRVSAALVAVEASAAKAAATRDALKELLDIALPAAHETAQREAIRALARAAAVIAQQVETTVGAAFDAAALTMASKLDTLFVELEAVPPAIRDPFREPLRAAATGLRAAAAPRPGATAGAGVRLREATNALDAVAQNTAVGLAAGLVEIAAQQSVLAAESLRIVEAREALRKALDGAIASLLAQADAALDAAASPALKAVGNGVFRPALAALEAAEKAIENLGEFIKRARDSNPYIDQALTALARAQGAENLLLVSYSTPSQSIPDGFKHDIANVRAAATALADETRPAAERAQAARAALVLLSSEPRRPALAALWRRFARFDADLLRAAALEALNLNGYRREIEALIRELVPSRRRLSYDFDVALKEVGGVFFPGEGSRLTLAARTTIDLLRPQPPKVTVDGLVGPFKVKLFGPFHALDLHFNSVSYRSADGDSKLDVRFGEVVVGEHAKFLEDLQAWLSPGEGSGLYRKLLPGAPGLEVGYGINLGTFGVGALSFSNVSLNAAVKLPFANTPAEIVISIGRVDSPFLISSTIFGGGGYLALTATTKRFIGLEANFSYGGVFAFGFGPLVGQGQITVGVYLNQRVGQSIELGSTFQVRGSARVACFGVMASLYVRLTMQDGKMRGMAIFSYSFDLGFHTISFRIAVARDEGTSMGMKGGDGEAAKAEPTTHPNPSIANPTKQTGPSLNGQSGMVIDGREFGYVAFDPVSTGQIKPRLDATLSIAKDLPDPGQLGAGRRYFMRSNKQIRDLLGMVG